MPTTPRKARILLREKKASIIKKVPFTIKLNYKTGSATQKGYLGVDTGFQHIGISVVRENVEGNYTVISKTEYALRTTMKKRSLIEARASLRRGRRFRNTPYRHPKWHFHRKQVYVTKAIKRKKHTTHWKKKPIRFTSSRPAGWLPPSIQQKVDHTIAIIKTYKEILPDSITTNVNIEVGRFDVARMKNPEIHGEMYQQGPQYDHENVRAYVFERDGYKCQCCKKKAGTKRKDGSVVKIIAHHIDFVSQGATDDPDGMITICNKCHTTKNHKPGGILYKWMMEGKKMARRYRDATFMNILRKRLFDAFPDCHFTYGNFTKVNREKLKLDKTHANDATAIALSYIFYILKDAVVVSDNEETVYIQQVRKKKRSLHEQTPRKGKKGEPNTKQVRNKKNTKSVTVKMKRMVDGKPVRDKNKHIVYDHKTISLFDKVLYNGKVGWVTSFTKSSCRIQDADGNYIVKSDKYDSIPVTEVTYLHHNSNWLIGPKMELPRL